MTYGDREPVRKMTRVVGAVSVLAQSLIGMLLTFEVVDWTTAQVGALMTVVGSVGTLAVVFVGGELARKHAYPAGTVEEYLLDADAVLDATPPSPSGPSDADVWDAFPEP